ncbi:hypothetical protein L3X38_026304 [Prunus dulcis]|uniref:Uncharacterized protein n=1 Tax=Prunus dulcis TaxID=3755 RepID=A0AAD4UP81_PRUDU|nr:hypothetical protein L3X38_026304 [Prunus dulcis]
MAVGMLHQSSQGHRGSQVGLGPNVDKHRHSRSKSLLEDYFIPNSCTLVLIFEGRYRMHPHLFNKIMHDVRNYDAYFVQKYDAVGVLGLLQEQKLTSSLRILAFGTSADKVDEIARKRKSTILG